MHRRNEVRSSEALLIEAYARGIVGRDLEHHHYVALAKEQNEDRTGWNLHEIIASEGLFSDPCILVVNNDQDPAPVIREFLTRRHPHLRIDIELENKPRRERREFN
ncbi:MAG: hypothetical protein ABSB42_22050 [Tepidisphaeraceae bacterium]|jgi:hypothetical protein